MMHNLNLEESDFRELDFLKESDIASFPAKIRSAPRGIVRRLTRLLPESRKPFWETLEVSESAVDLNFRQLRSTALSDTFCVSQNLFRDYGMMFIMVVFITTMLRWCV